MTVFGDVSLDTPCLPIHWLWVLSQGLVDEAWPCPDPVPEPTASSSMLCSLVPILLLTPWVGPWCWKPSWRLSVGLRPRFVWWELQGDFMERMSLDSYQITLPLTFGRLEFQTLEVRRQFTDIHCWPPSWLETCLLSSWVSICRCPCLTRT